MTRSFVSRFALVALCLSIGCKSNSSTAPSTPIVVVVPGVGSNYTLYEVTIDSAGVTQSTDTTSYTILRKNVSFGGFSDVASVLHSVTTVTSSSTQTQTDTLYFRFLPNGDVMESSLAAQFLLGVNWLTYPFGSHASQSVGNSAPGDTVKISEDYAGDQTITVNGQAIAMSQVMQSSRVNITGVTNQTTTTVMEYSPTTGIIGPSRDLTKVVSGASGDLSRQTLLSYTVK